MLRGAEERPLRGRCEVVSRAELMLRCTATLCVRALQRVEFGVINPRVPLSFDPAGVVGEEDEARVRVLRRDPVLVLSAQNRVAAQRACEVDNLKEEEEGRQQSKRR